MEIEDKKRRQRADRRRADIHRSGVKRVGDQREKDHNHQRHAAGKTVDAVGQVGAVDEIDQHDAHHEIIKHAQIDALVGKGNLQLSRGVARQRKRDEEGGDDQKLQDELLHRRQAAVCLFEQLDVIVHEADQAAKQREAEHQQRPQRQRAGKQAEGHGGRRNRDREEQPAHDRRPLLAFMP